MGRVGVITHRERHDGGFNIVHIKDAIDNEFATRESNVFIVGQEKPWISLPKGKGVKVCRDEISTCDVNANPLPYSSLSQKSVIAAGRTTLPATRAKVEWSVGVGGGMELDGLRRTGSVLCIQARFMKIQLRLPNAAIKMRNQYPRKTPLR